MKKLFVGCVLVAAVGAFYLVKSVSFIAKKQSYTIGTPSPLPHDLLVTGYTCVHGDFWGIKIDCGYRRWLHDLFRQKTDTPDTDQDPPESLKK